ncbi:hypothetical protein Tco_1014972, partial [Tanacetum coccineum]
VETKSKRKEEVDFTRGKGIELLSEVALTEEAQMKEVRKKSLRDFHKTHPSGSGTVVEKPPRVDKITPTVTSEGTCDKPGVPDVTKDESSKSESESWEQDEESEDDDQEEEEFVHTPTNDKDDDNLESESNDVNKSNEESDDVNKSDEESDDKTEVPVTSSSRSSDLASKFLNFLDIPHTDAEIVSPLDVHVHHEVPRTQAPTLLTIPVSVITESSPVYINIPQSSQTITPPPILTTPNPPPTIETTNPLSILPDFALVFRFNDRIIALEKEVAELKKDHLHT